MKYELMRMENMGNSDEVITLMSIPGWIRRFFGQKPEIMQFRGYCTVWHHSPSGKRASSGWEYTLAEMWQREKWKRKDNNIV